MSVKFNVKLGTMDMYRFYIQHTYTSFQGIVTLLVGVIFILLFAFSDALFGRVIFDNAAYLVIVLLLLLYSPVNYYFRAKMLTRKGGALSGILHFNVDDMGIEVKVNSTEITDGLIERKSDTSMLPWDAIYKIKQTKHAIYVYSSRVNAYVLPVDKIGDQLEHFLAIVRDKCPDYKLSLKRM